MSDIDSQKAQQHLFHALEQGITEANRQCITALVPTVSRDTILAMAVAVARLRARYLEAACSLGAMEDDSLPDEPKMNQLKKRREMFEEGRAAYEALRHSIERGYVVVDELAGG